MLNVKKKGVDYSFYTSVYDSHTSIWCAFFFPVPFMLTFWTTWAFSIEHFLLQNSIFICQFSLTLFRLDHFNACILFFRAFLRLMFIHFYSFYIYFLKKCSEKINRINYVFILILFCLFKKIEFYFISLFKLISYPIS